MILFDLAFLNKKIEELDKIQNQEGFWNDQKSALKVIEEYNDTKEERDSYVHIETTHKDIEGLLFSCTDSDEDMRALLEEMIDELTKEVKTFRQKILFKGEFDKLNVIMDIHSGAGGTEAQDWADMLSRMYVRWCERHHMKFQVVDSQPGEEAGIKSITFAIQGKNAYGLLKSEKGVHRLVRISPFNAQGKRQTSFASCDVMPEINEDVDVEIKDEDIRIDTYRSSGAGGQHINKTSSAIRITHFPTGIVVTCQNERSQHQNKDKAMQMLKTKLLLLKQEENAAKASGIRGEVSEIGWGNQIRSYVLQPYTMVKDLRTGEETGNADAVLDGKVTPFMNAYLKWLSLGCPDRGNLDTD